MHVERFSLEFNRIMAIEDAAERTGELALFLESHNYLYGARSAKNILLVQQHFPIETLHRILVSSLMTPSPDMALNNFERLAGVIPQADLAEAAHRKKRLTQFLLLCGSSPFLVNLIYKTPAVFRWLFLEDAVDRGRSAVDMLAELRRQVAGQPDFAALQKILRDFKRAEILRQAEQLMLDETGVIPVLVRVTQDIVSPDITGYEDNPEDIHRTRFMCRKAPAAE